MIAHIAVANVWTSASFVFSPWRERADFNPKSAISALRSASGARISAVFATTLTAKSALNRVAFVLLNVAKWPLSFLRTEDEQTITCGVSSSSTVGLRLHCD